MFRLPRTLSHHRLGEAAGGPLTPLCSCFLCPRLGGWGNRSKPGGLLFSTVRELTLSCPLLVSGSGCTRCLHLQNPLGSRGLRQEAGCRPPPPAQAPGCPATASSGPGADTSSPVSIHPCPVPWGSASSLLPSPGAARISAESGGSASTQTLNCLLSSRCRQPDHYPSASGPTILSSPPAEDGAGSEHEEGWLKAPQEPGSLKGRSALGLAVPLAAVTSGSRQGLQAGQRRPLPSRAMPVPSHARLGAGSP